MLLAVCIDGNFFLFVAWNLVSYLFDRRIICSVERKNCSQPCFTALSSRSDITSWESWDGSVRRNAESFECPRRCLLVFRIVCHVVRSVRRLYLFEAIRLPRWPVELEHDVS